MNKIKSYFNKNKNLFNKILLAICSIYIFINISYFFISRLIFIIQNKLIGGDVAVNYTVGKAIAYGYKPYVDYWDIKPIGIFLLHAISYKLTGGLSLSFYFCVLILLFISIFPLLYFYIKKVNKSKITLFQLLIFLSISLLFSYNATFLAGWMYPEFYGIFFCNLYIILLNTKKTNFLYKLILAMCILLASNIKEPFFLIILSIALIFCKTKKEFINKFIFPSIITFIITLVTLLLLNYHNGFFEYLNYMLTVHRVGNGKSIFLKGFDVSSYLICLSYYDSFLIIVFMTMFFYFIFKIININVIKSNNKIKRIVVLIMSVYIARIAVRSSGYFYYHHYLFFYPIYQTYLFNFIKFFNNKKFLDKCVINYLIIILCYMMTFTLKLNDISDKGINIPNLIEVKNEAEYIDNVLYKINDENYTFLGQGGHFIYAFTRHLPKGPYFIQESNQNPDKLNNLYKKVKANVRDSNVVVFATFRNKRLQKKIEPILKRHFTLTPYGNIKNIPRGNPLFMVFFRKKLH